MHVVARADLLTNEGRVAAHGGHSPKDKHEDVGRGRSLCGEGQRWDDHKQSVRLQPKYNACEQRVQVAGHFHLCWRGAAAG